MADANVVAVWPVGTDFKVQISGLQDDTGTYVNTATVTGAFVDSTGAPVTGATEITFALVTGSVVGDYVGAVANNADFLDGRTYTLNITANMAGILAFATMTRDAAITTL